VSLALADLPDLALPPGLLADIAAGLAAVPGLWRPHAHHGPERRPVRLLATPSYEAWVIGWTADQRVSVHDHGPSAGAVVVVEGTLDEVTVGTGGRRRALAAGSVTRLPVGIVHDIVAPGPAPATSIHVYSPPLRAMGFYEEGSGRLARVEPVAPVPAVHDAVSLVRALDAADRDQAAARSGGTGTGGGGPT
jgi:quercetin dioxygenase-like cupin family protein